MRKTFLSLAASAALLLAPTLSSAASYTFSGTVDDGPRAGETFTGSFEFDASGVTPTFEGDLALTSFSMQLFGQTYTLASADAPAFASYFDGSFLGVSYVDADAADPLVRPNVALVPGFSSLMEVQLTYDQITETVTGAGSAGFGSYSVAVVPEPAAVLLMLAGLGVVGGMARRARRAGDQAER